MSRGIEFVDNPPHVTHVYVGECPYHLWYIPEFPIARLRYTPLEDVTGETVRREMLAADIAARGLINPLLVWNHTPSGQRDSPRPYYLHLGYNKLWALKLNCAAHAPAILSMDPGRAPEFPCRGLASDRAMIEVFGDGDLVLGQNGPVFKNVASIDNWQLPK